jgi:hypothetical protein
MSSISPNSGASLPYDVVASGQVQDAYDPYAAANDPHAAAYEGMSDAPVGMAPMTVYEASAASYAHDAAADTAAQYGAAVSDVAGMQPALAAAPTATVEDFAKLGIFTNQELSQLAEMRLPPHELGILLQEAIAYMQSPEFAQQQSEAARQQQASGGQVASDPVAGGQVASDPVTGDPVAEQQAAPMRTDLPAGGWSSEWADAFRAAMKEQGIGSNTRMMVVAHLATLGLGEQDLHAAFEYYTSNEAGLAELKAIDEQVRSGETTQRNLMLGIGGVVLAAGAGTTALARSTSNLSRVLTRTAASGADDAARVAGRALAALDGGTLTRGTALADDAARMLRAEAAATSRLLHPVRRMTTSAAARHLTASQQLSRGDIVRYGLWMKQGDGAAQAARTAASGADDVARGASSVSRAVAGGGDDIARVAAGGLDDAARSAAQVGRTAGMFSKGARFLGPVGIIASAGLGAWSISKTMDAEGGFGEESAKLTGNVAGGLAGGIAGAAAGAAIGSVVPVIGTGIGAVVGGLVGGLGGGALGEGLGGMLHGIFG